jgi:tetratricopeptide (TPR) repeat protein
MGMIERVRMHLNRGEYLAVKRLVGGILVSEDMPPAEKAQAALMGARATMFLREPFLAAKFAEKALGLAQEIDDAELEGRALFQIGAARLAVGDNADARIYLKQFLAGLSDRWPQLDDELAARAYGNLGMALRNQRLYPDSLQAYWQALTRLQRTGDARGQVMCHHQMAWVLILCGDLDEAADHLEQAAGLGEMAPDLSTHQLTHEALLYLHRRDFPVAAEKAEEVLQPERPSVSPASKAIACYVMGDVARQVGHTDVARQFANMAMEAALEDGLASIINLVSKLRRDLGPDHTAPGPQHLDEDK